jgi:hypothetical protein
MQTFLSKRGRRYKRVPEVIKAKDGDDFRYPAQCKGCAAYTRGEGRGVLCQQIHDALNEGNEGVSKYCMDDIWIHDTPAGLALYVALKLEVT